VAEAIAERVAVPVIGIGAGAAVDGQVLVYHDLLGLGDGRVAKFVREYAALRDWAMVAIREFARDVRARKFPSDAEEYGMPADEAQAFRDGLRGLPEQPKA
jgi:3-methyl-2-oxobutanoate hydroxymethyltransferase